MTKLTEAEWAVIELLSDDMYGLFEVRAKLPGLPLEEVEAVVSGLVERGYVRLLLRDFPKSEPRDGSEVDLTDPTVWAFDGPSDNQVWIEHTEKGAAYYFGPTGREHVASSRQGESPSAT